MSNGLCGSGMPEIGFSDDSPAFLEAVKREVVGEDQFTAAVKFNFGDGCIAGDVDEFVMANGFDRVGLGLAFAPHFGALNPIVYRQGLEHVVAQDQQIETGVKALPGGVEAAAIMQAFDIGLVDDAADGVFVGGLCTEAGGQDAKGCEKDDFFHDVWVKVWFRAGGR